MLVGERMSRPVLSVSPATPIQEALAQMRKERVSRYPVINKKGKLVGIVSEADLLHASPSDATSLSVWEINYLVSKITVERVMTTEVITVTEDTPLEEAARIMADHRVGGLPVMKGKAVIGMITQTDLFRVFLEMLGARIWLAGDRPRQRRAGYAALPDQGNCRGRGKHHRAEHVCR